MNSVVERQPGYLVVRKFEYRYLHYDRPSEADHWIYSIPRRGIPPGNAPKKYCGVDRQALIAIPRGFSNEFSAGLVEPEAQFRLDELESDGCAAEGRIFELEEARRVFGCLHGQSSFELLHVSLVSDRPSAAGSCKPIGYDIAYFEGDHYSAIANCMFFPSWWGTDEAGKLYDLYFRRLNKHGLFDRSDDAYEFRDYYVKVSGDNGNDLECLSVDTVSVVD
jgi:hypothetical protein